MPLSRLCGMCAHKKRPRRRTGAGVGEPGEATRFARLEVPRGVSLEGVPLPLGSVSRGQSFIGTSSSLHELPLGYLVAQSGHKKRCPWPSPLELSSRSDVVGTLPRGILDSKVSPQRIAPISLARGAPHWAAGGRGGAWAWDGRPPGGHGQGPPQDSYRGVQKI